ncbi:MAG: SLC13 family permease [Clostridia bacterium]|nr:SLC13 family permease [Clostridia bacterium]
MKLALIIFVVVYILMIALPKQRAYVALVGAILFVACKILPVSEVVTNIDWNVLLMIGGTMGLVTLFIDSKMPARLSDRIVNRTSNIKWTVIALACFAGIISAFVDNVSTVLMIAPVAISISKKLKISPVPMVIAVAVASNVEGSATLVGDTTSIMLAGAAKMDFLDFFWFMGRPGLFFINQIGLIAAVSTLYIRFRKQNDDISKQEITVVNDYVPTVLLLMMISSLIIASFFHNKPDITNGLICVSYLIVGLIYYTIKNKDFSVLKSALKGIDYFTLILLASLFVIIGGIEHAGIIEAFAKQIVKIGGGNVFVMYSIILWLSVIASAFIDNIPYVATMLPVATNISLAMGIKPYILYFGLIVGATLGGNITPIGASANIAGIGILRKEGYEVKNTDFFKISIPFTLAAVLSGYIFTFLFYGNI